MSEPTQTCQLCGRQVVVKQDGRGFPPDIAKRKLVKFCQAHGCPSEPKYRAGVHGFAAMPAKPPVTLLSPAGDMPPVGAYLADPLTRVVVVTDEPAPTTVEGWNDIGERECWPRLMESARRRGLQPRGTWTMILDPGPDWRRHIAVEVQAKVDEALAHQPELRVLCVGLLVDSASVRAVPDE